MLWIAAIILSTVLTAALTIVLRNWHFLNDRGWRGWVRWSVQVWIHGSNVAMVLSLAGVITIASTFLVRRDRWMRRAAIALISLESLSLAVYLAYRYFPSYVLPSTPNMTAAVPPTLIYITVRVVATFLLWSLLIQCVYRRTAPLAWWGLLTSLLGCVLFVSFAAPIWYRSMFFAFCSTQSWTSDPWQVRLPWELPERWRHVLPNAAQIIMLAGALPFIRLLYKTRRFS